MSVSEQESQSVMLDEKDAGGGGGGVEAATTSGDNAPQSSSSSTSSGIECLSSSSNGDANSNGQERAPTC